MTGKVLVPGVPEEGNGSSLRVYPETHFSSTSDATIPSQSLVYLTYYFERYLPAQCSVEW